MNISAMILSGGKSSRMGQDKASLKWNQTSMIEHLANELKCDRISEVFISAAHEGDYAKTGLPVVADEHEGIGPLEGIRRGLLYAKEEYLFVCAVDMPFVSGKTALSLTERVCPEYNAYVFREGGRIHPVCAIYHKSVLPVIEMLIRDGNYKISELLDRVQTFYVDLEESGLDKKNLVNVNTPEEYANLVNHPE